MASDLGQLMINQQNKVSLYIDGDFKLNDVYLPRNFVNNTNDLTAQPVILGVDSIQAGVIETTTLYQKAFFSASGSQNGEQQFLGTAGGDETEIPVVYSAPSVIQKSCTFVSATGFLTLPINGYYRITYSVNKHWTPNVAETSGLLYVNVVENINGAPVSRPIATSNNPANNGIVQDVAGNNVVAVSVVELINSGGNVPATIQLIWVSNFVSAENQYVALNCPHFTVELISPYTA